VTRRMLILVISALALTPRHVLVTGGNKGIGKQICKRILSDYPDVHVLLGSRSPKLGESAVSSLEVEVPGAAGRIEAIQIDVSDEASIKACAAAVKEKIDVPLFGLVNNAGIGFGRSIQETVNINTLGPRRVCDAFIPLLDQEVGRVVNIASASGPNYVRGLSPEKQELFTSRSTTWEQLEAEIRRCAAGTDYEGIAYGLSKACLNVYTMQLAAAHPNLRINSCSPGYVLTDLTAGMGASNTPEQSNCHVAPLFLLFDEPEGNGRYYGSDGVRSPLDRYRGPGDPPYVGD